MNSISLDQIDSFQGEIAKIKAQVTENNKKKEQIQSQLQKITVKIQNLQKDKIDLKQQLHGLKDECKIIQRRYQKVVKKCQSQIEVDSSELSEVEVLMPSQVSILGKRNMKEELVCYSQPQSQRSRLVVIDISDNEEDKEEIKQSQSTNFIKRKVQQEKKTINVNPTEVFDRLQSLPQKFKDLLGYIRSVVNEGRDKCDGKLIKLSFDKVQDFYEKGLQIFSKQHQKDYAKEIKALKENERRELFCLSTFHIKAWSEVEKAKESKKLPYTLQQKDISRLINNVKRTQLALLGEEFKDKKFKSDFIEVQREYEKHDQLRNNQSLELKTTNKYHYCDDFIEQDLALFTQLMASFQSKKQ